MTITAKTQLGDGDDAFRAKVVGGSEVSALFDANPWLTHFELWHRKNGTIATPDFGGNDRIEAGIRLEPVIIDWACDKWGYAKRQTPRRLSNGKGLGGHPDQCVICPERGKGLLEVKMVDWLQFKAWGDEPPLHYLLQGNTYAGLEGVLWFDLIVLVGGNDLRRFQYEFRPKLHAEAERRTCMFWASIKLNAPPRPDYTRDLDPLSELYRDGTADTVDLTGDNLAATAAAEYLAADEAVKVAEKRREAAKAELVDKMGKASEALLSGFMVRASTVAAVPDREAVAGEIIRGRKAYRRYTVKEVSQ